MDHGCTHLVGSRTCRNCGKLCAAEDCDAESLRFMISLGDSGKNMRSWAQEFEDRIILQLPEKCELVFPFSRNGACRNYVKLAIRTTHPFVRIIYEVRSNIFSPKLIRVCPPPNPGVLVRSYEQMVWA